LIDFESQRVALKIADGDAFFGRDREQPGSTTAESGIQNNPSAERLERCSE
jgi:hypothetical protein